MGPSHCSFVETEMLFLVSSWLVSLSIPLEVPSFVQPTCIIRDSHDPTKSCHTAVMAGCSADCAETRCSAMMLEFARMGWSKTI